MTSEISEQVWKANGKQKTTMMVSRVNQPELNEMGIVLGTKKTHMNKMNCLTGS